MMWWKRLVVFGGALALLAACGLRTASPPSVPLSPPTTAVVVPSPTATTPPTAPSTPVPSPTASPTPAPSLKCAPLLAFIQAQKPVFEIEYELAPAAFCPQANTWGFSALLKPWDLSPPRYSCLQDYKE